MGLGKRLGCPDTEDTGNRVWFVGDIILHVLVLLEFFFRKGKEPCSRIGEVHTFIGADKKRTTNFLFHLTQAVCQ